MTAFTQRLKEKGPRAIDRALSVRGRIVKIKLMLVTALLCLCVLPMVVSAGEPDFQYSLQKPSDSIMVRNEGLRTLFLVSSETGIGSVRITPVSSDWPGHIAFRFQYLAGEGFTLLESLILTTEKFQAEGSVKDSGTVPFYLPDTGGNFDRNTSAAGVLDIRFEENNGAIEMRLPEYLLEGSEPVELRWIDAFR